jgi:cytochrome o ubiquinol oxidase subunit 2
MKTKLLICSLIVVDILLGLYLIVSRGDVAVLNPAGLVAAQERDLMTTATLLGLSIVIPVVIAVFIVAYKYQRPNTHEKQTADWQPPQALQLLWWIIPSCIILILAVISWKTTHSLDPYRPLQSTTKPLRIQVVALQWKWLFIYPEQNIATVNYVAFPERTPLAFELTADAPMNSFWIPRLGGQIYAMAGMVTKTHLMADAPGEFAGSAAEISGKGFAGMKFSAKAMTENDFTAWVSAVKASTRTLDHTKYTRLARPSENTPVTLYRAVEPGLYNEIVRKYMAPTGKPMQREHMEGMTHE